MTSSLMTSSPDKVNMTKATVADIRPPDVKTEVVYDGVSPWTVIYVLLGVGATAPVVLVITVAIVLRFRRAASRSKRRRTRATFNSAPAIDAGVLDAWSSVDRVTSAKDIKPTNRGDQQGDSRGGSRTDGIITELAVQEFFGGFQRVDLGQTQSLCLEVASPPLSSTRRSPSAPPSVWTTSSSSGVDSAADGTCQRTSILLHRNQTNVDSLPQRTASEVSPTVICSTSQCDNADTTATSVHTVVAQIETPIFNGFSDSDSTDTDELPTLNRMRRSTAYYDIAHLRDDTQRRRLRLADVHVNAATAEDMTSEEEEALRCLDAVTADYCPDPSAADTSHSPISRL